MFGTVRAVPLKYAISVCLRLIVVTCMRLYRMRRNSIVLSKPLRQILEAAPLRAERGAAGLVRKGKGLTAALAGRISLFRFLWF